MRVKDILKCFENHNPEAHVKIQLISDKSAFSISSKDRCTHCEKEVYLSIGARG